MTYFLITIISILIGYALGKNSLSKDTYQEIKREVEKRVVPAFRQPSGVVQRPSAQRKYDLDHPEVLAEKEEMSKSLEEGIEPLTP